MSTQHGDKHNIDTQAILEQLSRIAANAFAGDFHQLNHAVGIDQD